MKKVIFYGLCVIALFLVSCKGGQEKLKNQLSEIEQNINGTSDMTKKNQFRSDYLDVAAKFSSEFPDDTNGATYLFKASEYQFEMLKVDDALKTLLKIYDQYPKYSKRGDVMLNIAVSYDQASDLKNAHKFYSAFLKEFPNHKNAQVAKDGIFLLGKDINDLAAEFEKKLNSDKDSIK